ncbi:MAG TPA: HDOD domain-containing protein [Terracidiphilus sp.]|nr:HDOD domain-containing protein [Terracidiphilus sp.]
MLNTREGYKVPLSHLRLPPFSQVALRVVQLASKENVQLHELSDLISSDPALATEVLAIVNSLVYAPRFPINSILQAIAIMGANHLQGLCLTVALRGYIGKQLGHPAMRTVWRHGLATAAIAEQLASTGFLDRDVAFTCGVMHDIGRVALSVVHPREYTEVLSQHTGSPQSILAAEEALFGYTHCQIGSQLMKDWKLPEDFVPIVSEHHAASQPAKCWDMIDVVRMSCRMADTIGYPAFTGCSCTQFDELIGELPPREKRLFHVDAETLAAEVSKKIAAIESL